MSDLLALLGRDNLDKLSSIAGGTKVYVPRYYGKPPNGGKDSSERLSRLFGESLAVLLVFHFGDSEIYVPLPRQRGPIDRRKLNRLARNPNLSATRIALTVGCTRRAVEKVRERNRHNRTTRRELGR